MRCRICGKKINGAVAGWAHGATHQRAKPPAPLRYGPSWEEAAARWLPVLAIAILVGSVLLIAIGLIREAT